MSKKHDNKAPNAVLGDARIHQSVDEDRQDRGAEDQDRSGEDGTVMSTEERRRMLRNEWSQEALPTPPKMNGWHFCWLSTTNGYDPIVKRIRMGYQPVKVDELRGFENYRVKNGEFEGCVSCNEMVLFKLPDEIYQEIMTEFHYTMPLEEEQRIKENLRQAGGADENSDVGDGFEELVKPVRRPVF